MSPLAVFVCDDPIVVIDVSVVVTSADSVVDAMGKLRVRGTVDSPRLMMVREFISGVNVGASVPN